MTITQVGSAEYGRQPAGNSNVSVNRPTGVQADDVLVVFGNDYQFTSQGSETSPPDGTWTEILDVNVLTSFSDLFGRMQCWWKLAGGSEPSSYTFTNAGQDRNLLIASAWRGVDPASPIADAAAGSNNGFGPATSANLVAPSVTGDGVWLGMYATFTINNNDELATWTDPSGTSRLLAQNDANFIQGLLVSEANSGASGTKTASVSTTYSMACGRALAVCLAELTTKPWTIGIEI